MYTDTIMLPSLHHKTPLLLGIFYVTCGNHNTPEADAAVDVTVLGHGVLAS
jgi:hypothetical protein